MSRLNISMRCAALAFIAAVAFSFTLLYASPPALAQRAGVKAEFRLALQPHGEFVRHARWGEVWRPSQVNRNWRPYTVGRWVYSDDYGYYWDEDQEEADWGWVTYHYG